MADLPATKFGPTTITEAPSCPQPDGRSLPRVTVDSASDVTWDSCRLATSSSRVENTRVGAGVAETTIPVEQPPAFGRPVGLVQVLAVREPAQQADRVCTEVHQPQLPRCGAGGADRQACTTSERPSGDSAGNAAFHSAGVTASGGPITNRPDVSSCRSQRRRPPVDEAKAIPSPGRGRRAAVPLASRRDAMRAVHDCQTARLHRHAPDAANEVGQSDEVEGPTVDRPRQGFAVDQLELELPHLRLDVVGRWLSDDAGRPGRQRAQTKFRAAVEERQTAAGMPPDGGPLHGRHRARRPNHARRGGAIRRGEIEGCREDCAGPHRDVSPIRRHARAVARRRDALHPPVGHGHAEHAAGAAPRRRVDPGPLGAKGDPLPVGRPVRLGVVGGIVRELDGIATAVDRPHPDVEVPGSIGGVGDQPAVARDGGIGLQAWLERQPLQRRRHLGDRRRAAYRPGDGARAGQRQSHGEGHEPSCPSGGGYRGDRCRADRIYCRFRRRRLQPLDRRDEAVAALGDRLDEAGPIRRVAEDVTQPLDRRVQAMLEVDERVGRPQPGAELVARHDLAGVLHQQLEDAQGLLRDGDEDAAPAQLGPSAESSSNSANLARASRPASITGVGTPRIPRNGWRRCRHLLPQAAVPTRLARSPEDHLRFTLPPFQVAAPARTLRGTEVRRCGNAWCWRRWWRAR